MTPNIGCNWTSLGWSAGLISVQVGVSEWGQQLHCSSIEPGSHQPQLGDCPISPRGSNCRGCQQGSGQSEQGTPRGARVSESRS